MTTLLTSLLNTIALGPDGKIPSSLLPPPTPGPAGPQGADGADGAPGTAILISIQSSNGLIFKPGQNATTVLSAKVFENGVEVTNNYNDSQFIWRRVSATPLPPPNDDATWNSTHGNGHKTLLIDIDQVNSNATFFCDLVSP